MKLFDLTPQETRQLRLLIIWHLAYMTLVAAFFSIIYYWGFFKAHPFLKESPLFTFAAPLATALFVLISPWRNHWRRALVDFYRRLEGEPIFCLMGALVFLVGFFIYSLLLWGLGALGPSLFYM